MSAATESTGSSGPISHAGGYSGLAASMRRTEASGSEQPPSEASSVGTSLETASAASGETSPSTQAPTPPATTNSAAVTTSVFTKALSDGAAYAFAAVTGADKLVKWSMDYVEHFQLLPGAKAQGFLVFPGARAWFVEGSPHRTDKPTASTSGKSSTGHSTTGSTTSSTGASSTGPSTTGSTTSTTGESSTGPSTTGSTTSTTGGSPSKSTPKCDAAATKEQIEIAVKGRADNAGKSAAREYVSQNGLPENCTKTLERECLTPVKAGCETIQKSECVDKELADHCLTTAKAECERISPIACESMKAEEIGRNAATAFATKAAETAANAATNECRDAVVEACVDDVTNACSNQAFEQLCIDTGKAVCEETATNACAAEAAKISNRAIAFFTGVGSTLWSALPRIGTAVAISAADASLYSWLSNFTSKSQKRERRILWLVSKAAVVAGVAGATQAAAFATGHNCGYEVQEVAQILITSQVGGYVIRKAWSYMPNMPWTRNATVAA